MNPIQQAIDEMETADQVYSHLKMWPMLDKLRAAIESLRSLQKEVEGVELPKADFFLDGGSTPCWYESSVRTAIAAALGRGAGQADPLQKLAASMKPLDADIAEIIAREGSSLYAEATQPTQALIDMVLFCPNCGKQHVDMSEHVFIDRGPNSPPGNQKVWDNPPHRSHLCHHCDYIWRPADVPTNGVAAIKTKGKDDSPLARSGARAQPTQAEAPNEREAFGLAELDGLMELHQRTSEGVWIQGATSHNTVAKRDGQPDYRIAEFHHADDASFVDAAHKYMPRLIELARAALATQQAVQAEPPNGWRDTVRAALHLLNDTQNTLGRFLENHRNPSEKDTVNTLLGLHDTNAALRTRRELSDLLATPPAPGQVERVPLTYRQISEVTGPWAHISSVDVINIARAVEAAHDIRAARSSEGGSNG